MVAADPEGRRRRNTPYRPFTAPFLPLPSPSREFATFHYYSLRLHGDARCLDEVRTNICRENLRQCEGEFITRWRMWDFSCPKVKTNVIFTFLDEDLGAS